MTRVVMLAGHAPGWRKPWEQAAGLAADVITLRSPAGARGGSRRVSSHEYELGVVKLQPERLTASATGRVMRQRLRAALSQIEDDHGPVDVLHAHFYSSALHATGLGVPLVVSEHTTVFTRPERDAVVRRSTRVAQRVYDAAALVMPVSSSLATDMRRAGIQAPLRVVPNPVDLELFTPRLSPRRGVPPAGEIRVLFAQRLAPTKGIDTLLRALRVARAQEPRLVLRIAGAGPERERLDALVTALDLERAVTFLGHLEPPELLRELHDTHLLAFPSRGDSFGIPVIEALATGVPVVATRQGIVPDVVTRANGRIVAVDDVRALGAALVDVASWAPSIVPEQVAAGIAARFSPEAVATELRDVYELVTR